VITPAIARHTWCRHRLDLSFHRDGILELMRVTREGITTQVTDVDYEFQAGGNRCSSARTDPADHRLAGVDATHTESEGVNWRGFTPLSPLNAMDELRPSWVRGFRGGDRRHRR
jgi:hypothetical protein